MKRLTMTILLMIAAVLLVTLMIVLETAPPRTIQAVASATVLKGRHVVEIQSRGLGLES